MTAATLPTCPPCPSWCEDKPGHGYDSETTDGTGRLARSHSLELGTVIAEHDHGGPAAHPDVFVCLTAGETLGSEGVEISAPMVAVAAVDYPHLTANEARRVAAALLQGAARLDALTVADEAAADRPEGLTAQCGCFHPNGSWRGTDGMAACACPCHERSES